MREGLSDFSEDGGVGFGLEGGLQGGAGFRQGDMTYCPGGVRADEGFRVVMQTVDQCGDRLWLGEIAQGDGCIAQVAAAFGAKDGGVTKSCAEGIVVKLHFDGEFN